MKSTVEITERIDNRVRSMTRGQAYSYHTGHLAFDRAQSYDLDLTAKIIWRHYEAGRLHLVQLKIDNGKFQYFAVRA